ncbi:Uncharacterised protein [Bordetella pertussis]|nr:Uncharacterised protein [Bordetella pertussis]
MAGGYRRNPGPARRNNSLPRFSKARSPGEQALSIEISGSVLARPAKNLTRKISDSCKLRTDLCKSGLFATVFP